MLRTVYRGVDKSVSFIEDLLAYIACAVLVFMSIMISTDTILRYFFNSPILGVLEISEYLLMVAIVFFGMSLTSREGGHIKIEFVSRYIPGKIKKWVDIIINIIAVIFFYIIGLQAWKQTLKAIEVNQLSSGAVEFPMAPGYFIVVLGAFLMCIRLIIEMVDIASNQTAKEDS